MQRQRPRLPNPAGHTINDLRAPVEPVDRTYPGIPDFETGIQLLARLSSATFDAVRFNWNEVERNGGFRAFLPYIPLRANLMMLFNNGRVGYPLNDENKSQMLGIGDFIMENQGNGNGVNYQQGSNIQDIVNAININPVFTIRLVNIETRGDESDYLLWPVNLRGRPVADPSQLRLPDPIRRRIEDQGGVVYTYLLDEWVKLGLTWQRYGIMSSDTFDKVPCLYRALMSQGMDDDRLDKLKALLATMRVSRRSFPIICTKIKIRINFHTSACQKKLKKHRPVYYPVVGRSDKRKARDKQYGDWPVYDIGYAMNHYFSVDRKTGITLKALKEIPEDWDTYEDVDQWRSNLQHNPKYDWNTQLTTYNNKVKWCTSLELFKFLQKDHVKYFFMDNITPNESNMNSLHFNRLKKEYYSLSYDKDEAARPYGEKKQKKFERTENEEELLKTTPLFAFDFECTTDGDEHKPFGVAWKYIPSVKEIQSGGDYDTSVYSAEGVNCAGIMMKWLAEFYDESKHRAIQLIAHNAGYDKNFIFNYLNHGGVKMIESGNQLKMLSGQFKHFHNKEIPPVPIKVIDSNSFWATKLSSTVKMFKLDKKKYAKELVPYNLFKREFIFTDDSLRNLKRYISIDTFKEAIRSQEGAQRNRMKLKYAQDQRLFGLQFGVDYVASEVEKEVKRGMENAQKWNCILDNGEIIDFQKYVMKYCEQDVHLLAEAWSKFEQLVYSDLPGIEKNGDLKIDLRDSGNNNYYVSINQLANDYFKMRGCFEEVYEFAGVPRDFMQQFVNGGRCMLANNEKQYVTDRKISDFDACSLYPSAMHFGQGYITGLPQWIDDGEGLDEIPSNWTHFMMMMRIKSFGGVRRRFPVLSYKDEIGSRVYSDGPDILGKEIPVDTRTFEDLCEHYPHFEFEIVKGYFWNTPRNSKICEVIKEIYTLRRHYKKAGNPIQQVLKLFMNSAYGKTIMKPIDKKTVFKDNPNIKKTEKERHRVAADNDNYLKNHFYQIKALYKMSDKSRFLWRFEILKDINEHFSSPHIGSDILSMSKQIMNSVMCMAEDNGINIYYTDTDSMQIEFDKLSTLADKFKETYDRELIGNGMGQFHSDFDLDMFQTENIHKDNKTGLAYNDSDIMASSFIGCGKKAYLNHLEVKSKQPSESKINGAPSVPDTLHSYHFRLKGVNVGSVFDHCLKNNENLEEMYTKLFQCDSIIFDLTAGKPCFKQIKSVSIYSLDSFERRVQFKAKVPEDINRKRKLDINV